MQQHRVDVLDLKIAQRGFDGLLDLLSDRSAVVVRNRFVQCLTVPGCEPVFIWPMLASSSIAVYSLGLDEQLVPLNDFVLDRLSDGFADQLLLIMLGLSSCVDPPEAFPESL